VFQYVAVCCSVLQCVAAQLTTDYWCMHAIDRVDVLQSVAVYRSVLQRVAVCCSVLHCVAAQLAADSLLLNTGDTKMNQIVFTKNGTKDTLCT